MSSGIRLFTDPQPNISTGMRLSFNDTFPAAEFLFRNSATNPFSHIQFAPERIVEFSVTPVRICGFVDLSYY